MSAGPAREHLRRLAERNVFPEQVALGLGHTSSGRIRHILYGKTGKLTKYIKRDLEQAILNFHYDEVHVAPGGYLNPALSRRRLQSIWALGYDREWVMARIVFDPYRVVAGKQLYITARNARRIRDLYAEIGDTPGPSRIAGRMARVRGYEAPFVWDDPGTLEWPGGIEIPIEPVIEQVELDEVVVERIIAGWDIPTTEAELTAAVVAMRERGKRGVANALGIPKATVDRILSRVSAQEMRDRKRIEAEAKAAEELAATG